MEAYELMIKTNNYLIKGGELTDKQKNKVVLDLLAAVNGFERGEAFYKGVKYPGNTDEQKRRLYPEFFIPPYNEGRKLKTVLGQTPKTQILSANMYELEILRLLHILAPERAEEMILHTCQRLKTTCFGNRDDGLGECFDASLVVLRFLSTVLPEDKSWIKSRIDNYNAHAQEKKRPWFSKWYYFLCLSEMPLELAQPELLGYRDELVSCLEKSGVMSSGQDKALSSVLICTARNLLARLPRSE